MCDFGKRGLTLMHRGIRRFRFRILDSQKMICPLNEIKANIFKPPSSVGDSVYESV